MSNVKAGSKAAMQQQMEGTAASRVKWIASLQHKVLMTAGRNQMENLNKVRLVRR
jgi:hypothetical protein